MKKLCLIIILNFFCFNLALSSILIKDCKTIYPAGHYSSNPDNEVMGNFDGKKQYLINYEDGLVYYTGVATKSTLNLIEKLESEGLPTPTKAKVTNYNYKIQFIDENEVVAIRIQEYEEPKYNHFEEITIDLKNYRISKRVFADTEDGKVMINLGKKLIKNSPLSEICIKDGIYNISKASVETDSITAHDIAGLFIGDSALNFTSEEKIKANKKNWYKNKEITPVSIAINNPDYDVMSFSYRTNDPSYKVLEMTGMKFFRTNFQECLKRKDKTVKNHDMAISSELKNSFDSPLPQDSSGKSKSYNTKYTFDNGDIIFIACYDWSEESGKGDHFRYGILSNEFAKWVRGAHK